MSAWRLLLTRPQAECEALAAELAEQGHYGSAMPMLLIEPHAVASLPLPPNLKRFTAVVVVSKPAAQLGVRFLNPAPTLTRPAWFAVGAATAGVLEQAGLKPQFPPKGDDSEALWRLPAFEAAIGEPDARVLILRGEGGREWLAGRLGDRGIAVEHLELYRRSAPDYPADAVAQRLQAERLNGAVVSSGQGLEHLYRVAGTAWPELAARPLFVPSERVAGLARSLGCRNPINCRGAGSVALMAALSTLSP